jgi:hypothetical protein
VAGFFSAGRDFEEPSDFRAASPDVVGFFPSPLPAPSPSLDAAAAAVRESVA